MDELIKLMENYNLAEKKDKIATVKKLADFANTEYLKFYKEYIYNPQAFKEIH